MLNNGCNRCNAIEQSTNHTIFKSRNAWLSMHLPFIVVEAWRTHRQKKNTWFQCIIEHNRLRALIKPNKKRNREKKKRLPFVHDKGFWCNSNWVNSKCNAFESFGPIDVLLSKRTRILRHEIIVPARTAKANHITLPICKCDTHIWCEENPMAAHLTWYIGHVGTHNFRLLWAIIHIQATRKTHLPDKNRISNVCVCACAVHQT